MVKKTLSLLGFSVAIGFYTTFVLMNLWNWFAVPALHVPSIGYWLMYGLNLLIGLVFGHTDTSAEDDSRWVAVFTLLDACLPEGRRETVRESIEFEKEQSAWMNPVSMVFGKLVGASVTLALGWVIHTAIL